MSALITLRYSRSCSTADRTKFIEENKDTCMKFLLSLGTFDLVMLGLLKWEHDISLSIGIIDDMIGFFEKDQIHKRSRRCYLLEHSYARQPWAVPMDHEEFQATVGEFCKCLEDYAKTS